MEVIFILLSFFSLTWILGASSLLEKPRDYLISKSVFVYKLFDCPFCLGFHIGYLFYMFYNPFNLWSVKMMVVWALASAAFNYLVYRKLVNLNGF